VKIGNIIDQNNKIRGGSMNIKELVFFKFFMAAILLTFLTGCGGDYKGKETYTETDDDGADTAYDNTVPDDTVPDNTVPDDNADNAPEFSITSEAYVEGGAIPLDHICEAYGGANVSPQYSWANPPADTAFYALIMDDETAPCGTGVDACVHWAWFDIPTTEPGISYNGDITMEWYEGSFEGNTYIPTNDYEGPCPPNAHTYITTIYAMSADAVGTLTTNSPSTRAGFEAAYSDSILGQAEITGTVDPDALP